MSASDLRVALAGHARNGTAARVLAQMDDRKWIAIMVSSMLLLIGIAAVLVQRPELVQSVTTR